MSIFYRIEQYYDQFIYNNLMLNYISTETINFVLTSHTSQSTLNILYVMST